MTHVTRSERQKTELAQEVIAYLNEVLALDPIAIHNLCERRTKVNDKLAQHSTTQTGVFAHTIAPGEQPQEVLGVGLLGILNGLVGIRDDQYGYITAVYGDDNRLERFELTKREGDEPEEMHPDVGDHRVADIDAGMLINGHRREFVNSVQYYLNELLEDDSPQHVIGHIESECRDYTKLIHDAVKVYGYDKAPTPRPVEEFCTCLFPSVCHSGLCGKCEKPPKP